MGYAKIRQDATDFLNWLVISGHKILSNYGYTFSVMYLVKTNELASQFYSTNGLERLLQMLTHECLEDFFVAYNVLCSLWILSYNEEARREFEDVNKSIIENC